MKIDLDHIADIIATEKPRRISVSFDDWPTVAEGLLDQTTKKRGWYRKPIESARITYTEGDSCAYVMGVFVTWALDLNRGETRVEA